MAEQKISVPGAFFRVASLQLLKTVAGITFFGQQLAVLTHFLLPGRRAIAAAMDDAQDNLQENDLAVRKRRARFRAWHRGMQEADLILGRFADAMLPGMGVADLADFETLLEVLDQDILDWIMARSSVPAPMKTPIVEALLAFDWEGAAP